MWSILCLLAVISEAKANLKDVPAEVKEDQTERAVSTRSNESRDNERQEPREKEARAVRDEDINSLPTQALTAISGEVEKPAAFLGREGTPSPGADRISFKPQYLDEKVSFPVAEAPWWDRWWFSIKEWWALETSQ